VNKWIVTLAMIFSATTAFAKTKKLEAIYVYRTNLGYQEGHRLLIDSKNANLDGIKLSTTDLILGQPYIQQVTLRYNKADKTSCFAGTYLLKVNRDGKNTTETGCLNDQRGAILHEAFQQLADHRSVVRD
jgi:hypothetical protein